MAENKPKKQFHALGDPELDKSQNDSVSPSGFPEDGGIAKVIKWQDEEIRKKETDTARNDAISRARSFAFERRKRLPYLLSKGLQKPGSISFDVLRRAATAVHIVRICINVLKEKVTKTPWAIQPIDPLKKVDEEQVKRLEEFFKHPNQNNETFRTFLDKILEDLLVLDAVTIEKTRYPDGMIAELHYVDAATIRPVFDDHGNQDVIVPVTAEDGKTENVPVSYVQVFDSNPYGGRESGTVVALWPKKDFLYFNMHPQGSMAYFGYGLSPIEGVLGVVANVLNADNYNGAYFEEGAFPPMIVHLKGSMGKRELESLRTYLYNELEGKYYRPAILSGEGEMGVHDLKGITQRDMQFMDYMQFMATLLAAAYGLSKQDIGLTDDLNRATSEVQKDLSQAKGYGSILHLLEEVFNQEIVWKDFGFTDLQFKWVATDTTDPEVASRIYKTYADSGLMTINEMRKKIGETPYGKWADIPMVLTSEGYKPIIADEDEEKKDTEPGKIGDPKDEEKKDEKTEDVDEGETDPEKGGDDDAPVPADNIDKFQKSMFTDDGKYEVYLDDRGVGQPFIFYDIVTCDGWVIKPPAAVNLDSQTLEESWTQRLAGEGLNVVPVRRMTEVDVVRDLLPTDEIRAEFFKYQHLLDGYGSKKWEQKFGGTRRFPEYLVSKFVDGRNLRNQLLLEDMKRVPKDYAQAIKDLASMWKAEKLYVLGDRRADQYIISSKQKRAWGFDYQFAGNQGRWEGTKNALPNVLMQIPYLHKLFLDLTQTRSEKAVRALKSLVKTKKISKSV